MVAGRTLTDVSDGAAECFADAGENVGGDVAVFAKFSDGGR